MITNSMYAFFFGFNIGFWMIDRSKREFVRWDDMRWSIFILVQPPHHMWKWRTKNRSTIFHGRYPGRRHLKLEDQESLNNFPWPRRWPGTGETGGPSNRSTTYQDRSTNYEETRNFEVSIIDCLVVKINFSQSPLELTVWKIVSWWPGSWWIFRLSLTT